MLVAEVVVVVVSLVAPTLLLAAAVRGGREQRALKPFAPASLDDVEEGLVVVMPARNEEGRIGATLDALLASDPSARLRVVVVDDQSEDGTGDVVRVRMARDPRLSLLRLDDDPPKGVFGKPRALARGVDGVSGAIAVVDADVVVEHGTLGGLLQAHRAAGAAATSVLPRLDNHGFVEELFVPAFVAAVAVTHPPSSVMKGETAFLNGQLLVIDRSALDDVGGFDAVSDTVLEDVHLARLLQKKNHKLLLLDGRARCATRMYDGFAALVSGFGKNARALHRGALVPLALLLVLTSWLPWLCVVAAGVSAGSNDDAVAGAGLAVAVALMMLNRFRLGSPFWLGVLSPVAQLVVATVYVRAALLRRGSWRGRTFST